MKKIVSLVTMFFVITLFANENAAQNNNEMQKETSASTSNIAQLTETPSPSQQCPKPCILRCGYNAPAKCGSYDFYTKASFIYWEAFEEGLPFIIINTDPNSGDYLNTKIIDMHFDYKPGFKVGFGLKSDYDNWDVYFEYLWYHIKQDRIVYFPQDGAVIDILWFAPTNVLNNGATYSNVKAIWDLDVDVIDFELSRTYFVGKKLIFKPLIGLRSDWIKQEMSVIAKISTGGEKDAITTSKSWALGPRSGLNTDWQLGYGFRIFGNCNASLLYTNYYKVKKDEETLDENLVDIAYQKSSNKFRFIRTNLEFSLGLGWGCYFSNQNNHIDLTIGYDVNAFYNQNMLRFYSDEITDGIDHSPENLYTHGLNISLQLDF